MTAERPAIFHLVAPDEWAAGPATGQYRPPSLTAEGFVHFSYAEQVSGTANRWYRAAPALVALEVDPGRLSVPVRIEDSYGVGASFPHVYGPIPRAAVVAVHPLSRADDGDWRFTPGGADAAASPDR